MSAEDLQKLLTEGANAFNDAAKDTVLTQAMASGKSPDEMSDEQRTKFNRMLEIMRQITPSYSGKK